MTETEDRSPKAGLQEATLKIGRANDGRWAKCLERGSAALLRSANTLKKMEAMLGRRRSP
jgi:hypothetical protein